MRIDTCFFCGRPAWPSKGITFNRNDGMFPLPREQKEGAQASMGSPLTSLVTSPSRQILPLLPLQMPQKLQDEA